MELQLNARYFRDHSINNQPASYAYEKLSLDIEKTAFLLVDVYSVDDFGQTLEQAPGKQARMWWNVINNISEALKCVRRTPIPIIYMANSSPDIQINNSAFGKLTKRVWNSNSDKAFEQIKYPLQVQPLPNEYCLEKHLYSSFFDTKLDSMLRNKGITNIIGVGFWANVCLLATSLDAFYRNYNVIWIRDCTLAAEDTSEGENWNSTQEETTCFFIKLFERIIGYSISKDEFVQSCSKIEKAW